MENWLGFVKVYFDLSVWILRNMWMRKRYSCFGFLQKSSNEQQEWWTLLTLQFVNSNELTEGRFPAQYDPIILWHSETVRSWSLWWVQCVSSPLVFGLSRCLRGVSVESFRVIEAFSAVGNVDICAPSQDLWRRPEVESSGSDWKSTSNPVTHNLPIRRFITELSRRGKLNALLAHGSAAAPDDFSKPTSVRSANSEIIANMRGVLLNSPQAPVFWKGRFFPDVHRAVRAGCDTIRCSPFSWCCVHGLLYRRPGRVFSAAL